MSTRYKRTNWVRRLEDFSSGCSSGFGLGQCLIAGILAIFSGISRLLPVTRWLSVTLSPDVPVVSTVGASSLKSLALHEKCGMFPIFMNASMFRVPIMAWFSMKAKFLSLYIVLVAALSVGVVCADEFSLLRTTIGSSVTQKINVGTEDKPVWETVKEFKWQVISKPNKVAKFYLLADSLRSDIKINEKVALHEEVLHTDGKNDVVKYFVKYDDFLEAAIYTIRLEAKDVDGKSISITKPIVQIVGPATTEVAPKFTPCITATVPKKGPDGKVVTVPGKTYDVIVVDGTSAGIGAAITAAREGLSTCLLESTSLLGGMFTNGIGSTDISYYGNGVIFHEWNPDKIKSSRKYLSYGLMDELRGQVEDNIKNKETQYYVDLDTFSKNNFGVSGLRYTPSVIRKALYQMLKEQQAKLSITLNSSFISDSSSNTTLVKERDEKGIYYSITTTTGKYKGRYLIDATDSGDVAVALSHSLDKFVKENKENKSYCSALNQKDLGIATETKKCDITKEENETKKCITEDDVNPAKNKDAKGGVDLFDNFDNKEVPTFCLRPLTQAYSFVMTLQQHNSQKDNWSYMKTLPPNCFVNSVGFFGIEGRYTDDFFTKKGNDWSVTSGLLGTKPVIFQVKHHTTKKNYSSSDYYDLFNKVVDLKGIKTCVPQNGDYKRLGDELIDCNAHGVVELPTGYAGKKDDIERISVVDRYLNHTMCFLYRMQRHAGGTIPNHNIFVEGNQIGFTQNEDPLRGNFPARMYVREGRRINGLQTFTGKDVQKAYYVKNDAEAIVQAPNKEKKNKFFAYMKKYRVIPNGRPAPEKLLDDKLYTGDWKLEHPKEKLRSSIAVTTYGMDSHSVELAESGDGEIQPEHMNYITGPGNVPFGVMVPRHLSDERILVPLAASSGTWGQSVLRMEPTRLNMGQAAALAIKFANDYNILPRELLEPGNAGLLFKLQKELIWDGGKVFLYLDPEFHDGKKERKKQHMAAQFLGIWGIASGSSFKDSPYMFKVDEKLTYAELATMVKNALKSLKQHTEAKLEKDIGVIYIKPFKCHLLNLQKSDSNLNTFRNNTKFAQLLCKDTGSKSNCDSFSDKNIKELCTQRVITYSPKAEKRISLSNYIAPGDSYGQSVSGYVEKGTFARMIANAFGLLPSKKVKDVCLDEKNASCSEIETLVENGIFLNNTKTEISRGEAALAICNAYVFAAGWDENLCNE